MNVVLLRHTPEPEELVAMAARLCYSPSSIEELLERIEATETKAFVTKLASLGHLSPMEHVSFTFGVEGISRACSHQLVRHRLASYSQQSQRYVKEEELEYVVPPSIKRDQTAHREFEAFMAEAQDRYTEILRGLEERGLVGESGRQDARYLLPNAAETKIVISMNARELLHFFRVRCCERAQWEIRRLAERMLELARGLAPTIFEKAGPGCLQGPCPEGAMTCGKIDEVRKRYGVKK